jgi:exonuclease SbcD
MRLLHVSDFHVGVRKHGLDRRPDHDHVFAQIKAIAIEERVDVILNTGDTFDEPYPSIEVLRYGWSVLEELASVAPVVVVCGNHDGGKLLELMSTILKSRLPIHFIEPSSLMRGAEAIVTVPSSAGESIRIGAVPFIKTASFMRDYLGGDAGRATVTYAENVGSLELLVGQHLNANYDARRDIRVFAAHLLIDGAQVSGSEYRFHVESDFATKADRIPIADYVGFGHIHKPQTIAGVPHGRYAGSPIPIDFGEVADQKSVFLVTGKPGFSLDIQPRNLDVGRPFVDVRGTLDDIAFNRERYRNAIARVFVDLDAPLSDLDSRVRDLLPDTKVCVVKPRYRDVEDSGALKASVGEREPTLSEMFGVYLAGKPEKGDPKVVQRYFDELLDRVEGGRLDDASFADIDEAIA